MYNYPKFITTLLFSLLLGLEVYGQSQVISGTVSDIENGEGLIGVTIYPKGLEPNVVLTEDTLVAEFNYSPQANIGMAETIDLDSGDTLRLAVEIGGTAIYIHGSKVKIW